MGRLIVASNRTPAGQAKRAGGLAVALWDALGESGGAWFGWSGEVVRERTRGVRVLQEDGIDFALADLTDDEYEGFYLGFSNRALWPVLHYRLDLARFDERDFERYLLVSRKFAQLLSPLLRRDDMLWVHDYHFFLLGQELRQTGWSGRTGFFLHVPFPAPEVFMALPQHVHIARALAEFDLIGFQTERDVSNFRRYLVEECDGRERLDGRIDAFDKIVDARPYPIGIDAAEMARFAVSERAKGAAERIGRYLGERALIIGVDRMDYSKGLPQRMQAVGRLLETHTDLHGRVSFAQIAPPSRSDVHEYAELRAELDELAGRINGDYGDLDWIPIRYLARAYDRKELAGLYRLARVGLVTPLRDGMNLVAKEFVAAQDAEDPGVLILSEFAGAAEQLGEALIVNPHDIVAVADAIRHALQMPLDERRARWDGLDRVVREQDIGWWRSRFLADLEAGAAALAS